MRADASIEIGKSPAEIFAIVDDFSKSPGWLEGCVGLRQTSEGPRAAGATLHYIHRQGSGGTMDGVVTHYEKDRLLAMTFSDSRFEVEIEFRLAASGTGTQITHSCDISPKGAFGKLMAPMIRAENQKQVVSNLTRLKSLAED